MEILNLLPFCKTDRGDIGIATNNTFASSAWRISDEYYKTVSGQKFDWVAPDGMEYTEDRRIFSRPTEQEVREILSSRLKKIAEEQGLIRLTDEV